MPSMNDRWRTSMSPQKQNIRPRRPWARISIPFLPIRGVSRRRLACARYEAKAAPNVPAIAPARLDIQVSASRAHRSELADEIQARVQSRNMCELLLLTSRASISPGQRLWVRAWARGVRFCHEKHLPSTGWVLQDLNGLLQ